MPAAAAHVVPRFPQAPSPLTNGTAVATSKTTTSRVAPGAARPEESKTTSVVQTTTQTPSSIPAPSFVSITVAPAGAVPSDTTTRSPIPTYEGSSNAILKGYCTEPGYTILDGPTALWVPVVGCISSKSDCCPLPTTVQGTVPPGQTPAGNSKLPTNAVGGGGVAAFPISSLPSQGEVKGCPQDYHTVTASGGTACCPSSYWLWSTQIGGQIPCYSSLDKALVPPPIPETLAFDYIGDLTKSGSTTNGPPRISGTITPSAFAQPSMAIPSQKPTSAIVNIAYAMQYSLAPEKEPTLQREAKIGIGVGAAAGGVLIFAMLAFLLRRCIVQKRSRTKVGGYEEASRSQRFSSQVDMSRVAHEPAGVARTHGGAKYASVSATPVEAP